MSDLLDAMTITVEDHTGATLRIGYRGGWRAGSIMSYLTWSLVDLPVPYGVAPVAGSGPCPILLMSDDG